MRLDWVEEVRDAEDGMAYARAGARSDHYLWFLYEGKPYFYVADGRRIDRGPSHEVDDKAVLAYARTLWELSR